MHMADTLISPSVGISLWVVSACAVGYSAKRLQQTYHEALMPLMGVLGAFVFAAQMVNFSIPATGSSGHLVGSLLLSLLLGPYAGFLVIASVLTVQALFFADGGLLALGANLFNLGVLPCLLIYPMCRRWLLGGSDLPIKWRTLLVAVVILQLGAIAVVLETVFSGISALPVTSFMLLMSSIHVPIGCVEGLVTVAVFHFLVKQYPPLLSLNTAISAPRASVHRPFWVLLGLSCLVGGGLAWSASDKPDGLEWSVAQVQKADLPQSAWHQSLDTLQQDMAVMSDYAWPNTQGEPPRFSEKQQTSLAALLGIVLSMALICALVWGIMRSQREYQVK